MSLPVVTTISLSTSHRPAAGGSWAPSLCRRAAPVVADYIDTFYNPIRRHSHLGGVSPG
jgi:hypothetical protein